jgi:DDE superfamily endonuclease
VARKLLAQVLEVFLPAGEVVIGIDDTIERRWGARIKARGIYRDPVRSPHGHFVKASGLRWLSLMVIVPIPGTGRRWALPFLTVLAPSERWSDTRGRRHKKLTDDWARQAILQAKHWLAKRRVIIVADSGFAALDLIPAVRQHVCLVTRLRLDASLFAPAPARRPGQLGRPRLKGARLPKLAAVLADPGTV